MECRCGACTSSYLDSCATHRKRRTCQKKMIGHDAGEECEGAKVEVRPAKEEWVDEFVELGPHVRFHSIGDNLNR